MASSSMLLCESMFVAIISWFSLHFFKGLGLSVCMRWGRDSGLCGFSLFLHGNNINSLVCSKKNLHDKTRNHVDVCLSYWRSICSGLVVGLTPECCWFEIKCPECECILCASSTHLFVAWSACASQCVAVKLYTRTNSISADSFLHHSSETAEYVCYMIAWVINEDAADLFHRCICLEAASSGSSSSPHCLHPLPSEHGGQRSHLNHLLPLIQSDEVGQTPEQRGGNQDSSVDLH